MGMSIKRTFFKNNRTILKLFLTFFILYIIFIHWRGWDENSRLALTKALTEENRLEIDSFYITTGDRAYFNGHYYTDRAPGISFISAPIYSAWKYFYDNFFSADFKAKYSTESDIFISEHPEAVVYIYPYLSFVDRTSMILLTISISGLFGALSVVLFYDTSKFFTKNENARILTSLIFGFATLLFPYSIVLSGNLIGMFLALLSFRLYLKKKRNYYFLAGVISGIAILFDYPMLLLIFVYILIGFFSNPKSLKYFFIGAALGLLPLLSYNLSVFGSPFAVSSTHLDPILGGKNPGLGMIANPKFMLYIMPRILFYPERGLFFYYPVLIFSFLGFFYMKRFKIEKRIIALIFILFLLFNSSY